MTRARIFHSDEDAVRARGGSAFDGEAVWPDEYRLTAWVDVEDTPEVLSPSDVASVAFEKTQHIDNAWWENEGVERVIVNGEPVSLRSTSVGDVVVVGEVGLVCNRCGWLEFSVARPALTSNLF